MSEIGAAWGAKGLPTVQAILQREERPPSGCTKIHPPRVARPGRLRRALAATRIVTGPATSG